MSRTIGLQFPEKPKGKPAEATTEKPKGKPAEATTEKPKGKPENKE